MRSIALIAWYELHRLFLTKRGLLSLSAFGLVWFLILRYVIYNAPQVLGVTQMGSSSMGGFLNSSILNNLVTWQVPELAMFWAVMIYILPIFCVVLTADQTASDRARGTLRVLHLRASRDSIFFGRFVGQLLVLFFLIIIALATTLVVVMMRDSSLLLPALNLSAIVLVNLMLVLLPYTALMAWVSSMARSARQATIYAVIIWIVCSLLTGWLSRQFPELRILDMVLPGSQVSTLLTLSGWKTLSLAFIPIVQMAILLFFGRMIMQRSDW